MPPETKQTISRLEEMTCNNCIYSIKSSKNYLTKNEEDQNVVISCICYNPDSPDYPQPSDRFCSKGKWFTGRIYASDFESELSIEDYDDCYYQIVRAQKFPGLISFAEEYKIRQQVLLLLDELIIEPRYHGTGGELLNHIKLSLIKLWGDQE